MYWGNHMSAGGWILSVLWTLIILALIVAGMVWLFSAVGKREGGSGEGRRPSAGGSDVSAREILDRRLASGELTIEQYRQLRETIGDPAAAAGDSGPPRSPAGTPG